MAYELLDFGERLKTCLRSLEKAILCYTFDSPQAQDARDPAIAWVKEMRKTLNEIVLLIVNQEFETARSGQRIDTSDTMPCAFCNDHYPHAGEHVRGVQYEPVPGKGYVYICWECAMGLQQVLNGQVNGLAYNLLFSRSKETTKLRENVPSISKLKQNKGEPPDMT